MEQPLPHARGAGLSDNIVRVKGMEESVEKEIVMPIFHHVGRVGMAADEMTE
jgi:hypothetical protein